MYIQSNNTKLTYLNKIFLNIYSKRCPQIVTNVKKNDGKTMH
jgi:hypothetical protein